MGGNTAQALGVMAAVLKKEGIECEVVCPDMKKIRGCLGCDACSAKDGHWCVQGDDGLNEIAAKARDADGLILASPTYYAGIAGHMKCCLDRLFYTSSGYFRGKVGTAFAVARRAGAVHTVDQLNHYFALAEMSTPPSQYWQGVYGAAPGEVLQDAEGVQTLERNAQGMAYLLKAMDAAKKVGIDCPAPAANRAWTNFIR
jgi:multimeric flavodoxin WrbA